MAQAMEMSQESISEYTEKMRGRYRGRTGKQARSKLLDEYVAVTDYERKYANKVLRNQRRRGDKKSRRGAPLRYGAELLPALKTCWLAMERPCGKRMADMLPLWVNYLEDDPEVRSNTEWGQKKGETATAIELRQSGENSILGNIAFNVSASLTQVLRWAYWWNSTEVFPDDITTEQVLIELNTDFSTKGLASQDIQAIVAAWQAGAIIGDTMTELFRRGEVLPEGRTTEEEEEEELIGRQRAAAQSASRRGAE